MFRNVLRVRSKVSVENCFSYSFSVNVGLYQAVLSLFLFILVTEALSKEFWTSCPWELLLQAILWLLLNQLKNFVCLVINTISLESHLNKKGLRINMKRRRKPCLALSVWTIWPTLVHDLLMFASQVWKVIQFIA